MGVVEMVLLVDDDEDLCDAVGDVLLTAGVQECLCFASLADVQGRAAEALRSGLAIVDVNLGHDCPNGVDVCDWLRNNGYAKPVVFMTGHATGDPRLTAALKRPDTRLMLKPFSIDALVQVLRYDNQGP
jgi:FixJ family two-component response regulator